MLAHVSDSSALCLDADEDARFLNMDASIVAEAVRRVEGRGPEEWDELLTEP